MVVTRLLATKFEIWQEGYVVTGQSGKAVLRGKVVAKTFEEACEQFFNGDPLFDPERMTYWGCELFDNEKDARKSFG